MTNNITTAQVYAMARAFLDSKGLQNWRFAFNTNKRRLGVCKFRTTTIEVSIYLLNLGWAEVEDTVKHEAAHAAVGPKHGHDIIWRMKAREFGCRGTRCGPSMGVDPTWFVSCACGRYSKIPRFKKTRRSSEGLSRCCHQPLIWEFNEGAERVKLVGGTRRTRLRRRRRNRGLTF